MQFKQWMEISREELGKIGSVVNQSLKQNRKDNGFLFGNIFGDKLRLVVPLDDPQERQLKDALSRAGWDADYGTGMATTTIQTERGPKTRQKRIGAVLADLSKTDPEIQKYAHYWEKNKVTLGRPKHGGVSMVISRSPIDIVRMSDHSEWESCHSVGGSYYRCAIQEAKTGGAIAYIVRNSDLSKVPDLQAKDIFRDDDRGIDGIEPLERIRLRRLGDDDVDYLVPELKTYGTKHTGFLEALTAWARRVQNIDPKNPSTIPDYDKLDLYGGSYRDSEINKLWTNFTGVEVRHNKASVDQDEEKEKQDNHLEELREEARGILNQFVLNHYDVRIDEDNDFGYHASVVFGFSTEEFHQVPLQLPGTEIIRKNKRNFNFPGIISDVVLASSRHDVEFTVDFYDGDMNGENLDAFREFCTETAFADESYATDKNTLRDLLVRAGYMKDWKESLANLPLQHFEVLYDPDEDDDDEVGFQTKEEQWIGDLDGVPTHLVQVGKNAWVGSMYPVVFGNSRLADAAKRIFPQFIAKEGIKFYVNNPPAWLRNEDIRRNKPTIDVPVHLFLGLSFTIDNPDVAFEFSKNITQLDQHWNSYIEAMSKYLNMYKSMIIGTAPVDIQALVLKKPQVVTRTATPQHTQHELPFKTWLGSKERETPVQPNADQPDFNARP